MPTLLNSQFGFVIKTKLTGALNGNIRTTDELESKIGLLERALKSPLGSCATVSPWWNENLSNLRKLNRRSSTSVTSVNTGIHIRTV